MCPVELVPEEELAGVCAGLVPGVDDADPGLDAPGDPREWRDEEEFLREPIPPPLALSAKEPLRLMVVKTFSVEPVLEGLP